MDYSNQTKLIKELKKGEERAFIYLINTYNKRLYGYALSLSNNKIMAQDIIQNVFLRIWEKRKTITINTSVQNYLYKSVYNEFLNLYRKHKSTMLLEQKYFQSLERTTANYDENSFKKALDRITIEIQALPPKCREVFMLSRREGLTNIEISDHLNISTKTVEAHITKAFSVLRKKLGDKLDTFLFLLLGYPSKA
ncbi:RNA polymerase sigma-70 factor [Flavivirga amylovorans]|uniref:RNA polymerase sigma-70 factor n=1 Tax=Flavivirga amylovorans TaxID=870486 RepID=A0ABT8WVU5_9FLAO|nr:RNA polymerase sigma-70 factor [Flavivirga amylovorans]MDO5985801.1 RNA polymerase sigma-70 factor [Flavivirga amylovorans]